MKNKIIISGIIVFILYIINYVNVYAISLNLDITGDKKVEVDKTIQLKVEYWVGNDMWIPNEPNGGIREISREDVTNKSSWSSSNNNIAIVDSNGKVTGVSEGTATITVKYDTGSGNYIEETYKITVTPKSNTEQSRIRFFPRIPEPAKIINNEHGFELGLTNIPDTEKANIKFSIDNEDIAKITNIDLCNLEDGSGKGFVIVKVKFLTVGTTKLNAILNYNGNTYTDSYVIDVIKSAYSLKLSANEYTDLPSTLEVGNKIQLTAMFHVYGGSLSPRDVTNDGITWSSSDDKIVNVNSKGLVTAVGEGNATITAKYNAGDEAVTATYNLKITDSTKSPVNSGNSTKPSNPSNSNTLTAKSDSLTAPTILPKTGENVKIMYGAISLIAVVSIIMYKKYKKYKDV